MVIALVEVLQCPFLLCVSGWPRLWPRCQRRSWANTSKLWCSSCAATTCRTKTWKCHTSDTLFAELHIGPTWGKLGLPEGDGVYYKGLRSFWGRGHSGGSGLLNRTNRFLFSFFLFPPGLCGLFWTRASVYIVPLSWLTGSSWKGSTCVQYFKTRLLQAAGNLYIYRKSWYFAEPQGSVEAWVTLLLRTALHVTWLFASFFFYMLHKRNPSVSNSSKWYVWELYPLDYHVP